MLGWLGGFFGLFQGNETASNIASDIASGVDKLIYTEEEKADASAKAFTAWLKMVEIQKNSESYRSITRRILAVFIIMNLFIMIWMCVAAELIHAISWMVFDDVIFDIVTEGGLSFTNITWSILKLANVFQLGWVFCTIIVFYFGPHLIQFFSKGKKA